MAGGAHDKEGMVWGHMVKILEAGQTLIREIVMVEAHTVQQLSFSGILQSLVQ